MSAGKPTQTVARNLRDLIAAQAGAALPPADVVVLLSTLFEQVAALHQQGRVALLDSAGIVIGPDGDLVLGQAGGAAPRLAAATVEALQARPDLGVDIIGTLQIERAPHGGHGVDDLALQLDMDTPITRPVYLPGPASWEMRLGHHDEVTDVFLLGMALAALACGLDFAVPDDLRDFVAARRDLFALQPLLHPALASLIVDMTELDRHARATDVEALSTRLRTWRDQPVAFDFERALAGASGAAPRRAAVLSHLRDRLFDTSRRNRLLYFRPTAQMVNLTVASVPLMLQVERIQAEQLCTWGGPFAHAVVAGKPVALQQWLRFEDQPYLAGALDHLIADTRRNRAEFGFSNLRLVAAFLRWHNLKEAPQERIVSPLLWLPVELVKRKGVRDQYVFQVTEEEAEFNPVLRHHLDQLYGIRLPETVDLSKTSLSDIHADLIAQIRRTEPAVELRIIDKAAIRLVRQKALQRMQQYRRRKPGAAATMEPPGGLPDHSYAPDDYRPLGRALYERWVRPSALPQRFEAGAPAAPRQPHMAESDDSAVREGYVLEESEGHRYAWDLDLTQVTLANLNYKKMSLVRDYAQLIGDPSDNPAFDRVFSIEPRALEGAAPAPLTVAQRWNVVAADATQDAAVALARDERSFIIQGPPGTGKSQTITNLIADYAARGQRVLFVCEKRAALDVVFSRLRQSGLDPLCCLIHDSQTDKKAFIADLKGCYERWIASADEHAALGARRAALLERIAMHQERIDAFEAALVAAPPGLGGSVRALLRRLVALPPCPELGPARRERLPALAAWDGQRELATSLQRFVRERFGLDSLAAHPFARLSDAVILDTAPVERLDRLCREGEPLLDTLELGQGAAAAAFPPGSTLGQARAAAAECVRLLDSGLASHFDLLKPGAAARAALRDLDAHLAALREAHAAARLANTHWRDPLSPADTESALSLARRLEGSAVRWLQPQWWRLRGELKRRYAFDQHAIHPGYARVLEQLAAEHAAAVTLAQAEAQARQRYGVADIQAFTAALADLERRAQIGDSQGNPLAALLARLCSADDGLAVVRAAAGVAPALESLGALVESDLALEDDSALPALAELLRDLRESLDDLPDMLPLLRALQAGDPACASTLRRLDLDLPLIDAAIADEALGRLRRACPVLDTFGGAALAQAARAVADGQRAMLGLNADAIRAALQRRFADHVQLSATSATQLDADGKALKKRYASGRRELEHEFGKTMRHRSIRDLAGDDTGLVVNDLKPVWLMSPLSVSDTLPLSADLFDVVIFDEASQIPVEEAVPALSRARQVVVVGDEMQLPPTSFFAAGTEADDEVVVEEDGARIAISLDADSLLSQAARNLPATLLAWHYRSRHESLISFSNAAFYAGRLVTIPDRLLDRADQTPPVLQSSDPDAGVAAADALMARPVSFHRVADGVYEGRRNVPEARCIATMVRELLARETGLSLGIVAFSEAQQGAIEDALDALGEQDPAFAARLEREYAREDDGQFNGLFVKNLENVQGDERDVIVLSICYAPGPDGRMLMNFGPINQRGGEKRLNVIFSRARHRMAVVSTIGPEAITNIHNDGATALRAFLQFAQASAAGRFEHAQATLGALNRGAQQAFTRLPGADAIRDALAASLRARGHRVEIDVGRSSFRCDLAIVDPSGTHYALGILLDGPSQPVGDTAERYVFRPGILRSFGWRLLDLPGKDWLDDPAAVLRRVETMLAQGEDEALRMPSAQAVTAAPPHEVQEAVEASSALDPGTQPTLEETVRSLRFEQGSSAKFWRARLRGAELTIGYGRLGSNGQTLIKQYDTPERALREMGKLVDEKLRKGYVEVDPSA